MITGTKIQFAKGLLIASMFMMLLWMPAVDSVLHLDHSLSPNENRALAPRPVFDGHLAGVRDYLGRVESYFNDHFGLRNRLIRTSVYWKGKLFRQPTQSRVLTGQDGWLYYSADRSLDDWYGRMAATPKELLNWKALLDSRQKWLQRRGVKYIFIIPPNKQTIYPEHLPNWMPRIHPPGRAEQIIRYLKTNTTVEIIDLRPPLAAAAKERLVFLLTDSHWNPEGALLGFQAIVDAANREGLRLQQFSRSEFHDGPSTALAGDLAKLLGQENQFSEHFKLLIPNAPTNPVAMREAPEILAKPELNPENVPVILDRKGDTNIVILFHDSFARRWKDYMSLDFGRSIFIWRSNWDTALIEREKPALVIDEMVERLFDIADPVELRRLDGLK